MVQGLGYISGLVTIRDGLEMFWVVQSLGSVGILGSESRAWVMFSSDLFNRLNPAGNMSSRCSTHSLLVSTSGGCLTAPVVWGVSA